MNHALPPDPPRATVTLGGEPHPLLPGDTLAALLQRLGHAPEAVATAVNGAFVARALRDSHVLRDGDQVHCFKPIVGG
ncbi:sulfur carrier protein ThiS [Aquincola sp. MAHUQ-54]|uniref:Sulfur carrier protein ThiS n=1 Tax=Aquincola agrisoli TaxID=3119538 RepID=A0AAW9QC66_9BURK